ncbi:MAG: CHASE3 domain-containing protein [Ferruginibacter sp.]|nr:CHASE3 domain-containing protein [Ferruginibacter sp.]
MKIYKNIRLIYIAAGLSIAILVTLGLFYMIKSRDQVQHINAVEHTYKVLSSINFCEKTLIEAEAAQRGYLLTGENNYRELFDYNLPLIDSSLKKIGEVTSDNDGQKAFFFQLTKYVVARVAALKANLMLKGTDPLYFDNLRKGAIVMDNCRFYMSKMRAVEEALLRQRLAKKNEDQRVNFSFFKATFITACLICIIAIGIFFRELDNRLVAQKNLKNKINELSNSNKELEEITFAASHDLQEPMRKLRILSNLVTKKFTGKIPETDLEVVHRINKITEQMHGLLNDLVLYTNLLNPNETYTEVNLYEVLKSAYYKVFKNENVQIAVSGIFPVIKGSEAQLESMLFHLFDNALKFKSPDRDLAVSVHYERMKVKGSKLFWEYLPSKQYHQVTITDNGIGFEKQYNEKIFGLFQRLHTQTEYPGKGIGLSVARRVMANHKGFITCTAEKKAGASFMLYFPVSG